MRIHQIITEAVKTYLPMFNGLPMEYADVDLHAAISKFENILKRKDRVIWYLRWYRIVVLDKIIRRLKKDEWSAPETTPLIQKLSGVLTKQAKDVKMNVDEAVIAGKFLTDPTGLVKFKHYIDLGLPNIDRVEWSRQSPEELTNMFDNIEQKWQADRKTSIEHTGDETMILDFHNGWAWFNLNRGGCSKEAAAMGHCGNGAGGYGETILSLRKHVEDDMWTPRATFILKDGILGEMKGRFNEKPEEKYHDYIVALLRHDIIKGVKGGGYAPQNNFAIDDLDPGVADELVSQKPELQECWKLYKEWHKQKEDGTLTPDFDQLFRNRMEAEVDKYGGAEEVDFDAEMIVIQSVPDYRFFQWNAVTDKAYEFFDNIGDLLEAEFENVEGIAKLAHDDHYGKIMGYLLDGIARTYQLDVGLEWEADTITTDISFSSLLYTDDVYLENIAELGETNDIEPEYDGIDTSDFDNIDDMIVDQLINKRRGRPSWGAVLERIYHRYGDGIPDANGSPTIKHPDQYEFDL